MNRSVFGSLPWPASPHTLVLAGGGNRCWWQAGLLSELMQEGAVLPPNLIGTSAGAAIATAAMTGGITAAKESCLRLYADNTSVFRWRGLVSGKLEFAHQYTYPAWISSFVNTINLNELRQGGSRLLVAVSRHPLWLGLPLSVGLATLAYVLDKRVFRRLHPLLPRRFGLRLDFLPLHECETHEVMLQLLCATAAAPPILPALPVDGRPAFDGGYTDHAPLPESSAIDISRSLTLLTRHYPKRPAVFHESKRWYWQPSRPVPVSTWDCTRKTSIDAAFDLGRRDARIWMRYLSNDSLGLNVGFEKN
jgi:predicted patatin/cPLA2 family phospholipase